ncbi:LysR family transcriptional regulator [Photobacterium sp. OFAV2-7]|uniref:LysR family transcriptional regulator n=1 Tax=Photobacterium sp. OFAV2-7 TaxID=2917748 RepID=UPI001EF6AC30|nr:LysR family transcriptional regulator [Photobacterium sp. OFAV2-7]MCG7586114.1 LysR family transcriptional regulator [Photobacterium sp. OFAV2-7]
MDTLTAMRSFVRVVETGSFSAVAREENTTQSTISKRVAILESNLGTQLLVRGSRLHSLTEAGQNYYERVVGILRDLEEAESEARSLIATPRGKLRVSVPVMFGTLYIAPVIPEFLSAFPEVQLDLKFSEKMVNLVEEGIDVAIRLGDLKDSSMIARHLGDDDLIIVASPSYLAKHSVPQHPSELSAHNCLVYSLGASGNTWTFSDQHSDTTVQVSGNFQGDSGCGLMEMLLADAGVSFMPSWLVSPYVQSGQLVHILQDYYKSYPINAVYPLNRNVPLKTKSFMDFIQQKLNQNPIL